MKEQDKVGVDFVNVVLVRGVFNGVVNLTFGTYNFSPQENSDAIEPDPVVSLRLRMDGACAVQLRDSLIALFPLDSAVLPQSESIAVPEQESKETKAAPRKRVSVDVH